jgi:Protein of unknown function (DUF3830)
MLLHATEARSGLDVQFRLLEDQAPAGCQLLLRTFRSVRDIAAIHAMWTGPEISCPIPLEMIPEDARSALPQENATIQPQPGDLVLAYVPARTWGDSPDPIFDLGIFYGPGGRMLFPIGWLPGSVVARIVAQHQQALADSCVVIRRFGACTIRFRLEQD